MLSVLAGCFGLLTAATAQTPGIAYSIELTGTIDPATEAWMGKALEEAEEADAEIAIVRLDTPGGLDTSMREIIQDIIAAPMPVVVYVSPDGARAASAGLFITQSADVAAMAPQTNIGSASPVSVGGGDVDETLGRKIENDAAAYVRALTEEHGRNGDLAEQMVTEAENVTAAEALEQGLIDMVAGTEEELLGALDGFEVKGPKEGVTLETAGLEIEPHDMPLQFDLLQIIVNPTVSFLLLSAGLLGLAIEIFSPGLIAPGALGLVSFLLGLYGTSQLPVTLAGIALLFVGVALIIAEAHVAAGGIMGVVGVIAIVLAGLLLYDTNSEALDVSVPAVIAAGVVLGGLLAIAAKKVVEARRNPARTGWEELVDAEALVRQPLDPVGQVFVEGALWRAEANDGVGRIPAGARVRVESVEGLTLRVRPVDEEGDS